MYRVGAVADVEFHYPAHDNEGRSTPANWILVLVAGTIDHPRAR
jgi:hypothetical protein